RPLRRGRRGRRGALLAGSLARCRFFGPNLLRLAERFSDHRPRGQWRRPAFAPGRFRSASFDGTFRFGFYRRGNNRGRSEWRGETNRKNRKRGGNGKTALGGD